jgi:diamine N-acetyltransferase
MHKRDIEPIVSGRVRLRLLREADLAMTRAWRNQDHIRPWFFTTGLISEEQHRAWFDRYQQLDDDFVFVIEETETLRRPVGQAALYRVEWTTRRAEFGRLLIGDAEASGLGLGRLATEALTRFALDTWSLHEIYLDVLETNSRAIAIYEQCGFVVANRSEGSLHMTRAATP